MLPPIFLIFFILMLFSGLYSTLDSVLCAISSLTSIDIYRTYINKNATEKQTLFSARVSIVILAIAGLFIANLPGLKVLHLWLFFGTLRASNMFPTILSLFWKKIHADGVFYGVLAALVVGLPLFTIGALKGNNDIKVLGSILTIVLSSSIAVIVSLIRNKSSTLEHA